MRIEYLFSKSRQEKLGSKVIAWGTGKLHPELEPCSHVALKLGPLIIESTLTKGVNIQPYQEWIKYNKVVHAFLCPKERRAVKVLDTIFAKSWGKKYDYFGILFFAWRVLGFIILKRPLPQINRWESKKRYFCVELVENITGEKYQMTSPIQLVAKWDKCGIERLNINKYDIV